MITDYLIQLVLFFLILVTISFLLKKIWSVIFTSQKFQLLVFPGVLLHEFSHMIGCFITGAKVDEVSFFSPKGSYVKHGKPKIPLLGSLIISFAPIAGGISFLWLISGLFQVKITSINTFEKIPLAMKELISTIINRGGDWSFWLFLYLVISTAICLSPSKKDIKNSAGALVFVLALFFLLSQTEFVGDAFFSYLIGILAIGIFFGFLAFLVSLPIFFIRKLI